MTCRAPAWWTDVRSVDVLDALQAVGLAPLVGKGRSGRWAFGHTAPDGGACSGMHGSGEAAIFVATQAGVLKCRACDATITTLEIAAASIGHEVPTAWDEHRMAPVRAVAASYGWCEGEGATWTPADRERATEARVARLETFALEEAERAKRREAEGLDVTAAWTTLAGLGRGHDEARRWAYEIRGWPGAVVDRLPVDDVTMAFPGLDGPAGRLCNEAVERGYRLLLALRDGEGQVRSVERRWPEAGPPPPGADGKPRKTLALPSERIKAGPAAGWTSGVRVFGSLPAAVEAASQGRPVAITEGGPDYMVAAASLRWGGHGVAIGSPSVGEQAKITGAFRAACVAAGVEPHRVRVVVVAHKGQAGERAGAACVGLLQGARVRLATLPTWADDLADVAKGWRRVDVLHRILTQAPRLAPQPFDEWPETFRRKALEAGERR